MKKSKVFFKNNIKLFIGIIIGITISCVTVFAATTLLSQSVYYNNTNSGATSTNVQGALDELYTKANTWIDPSYIDFTTLTTNTNRTILASKNGICIYRNNKVNCFKANNGEEEMNHIQEVFSDITCTVNSNVVSCQANDFWCAALLNGRVWCHDNVGLGECGVDSGILCS